MSSVNRDIAIRRLATVAVWLSVSVLIGTLLIAVPAVHHGLGLDPTERAGYLVGEQLDAKLPPVSVGTKRVVLIGSSTCGECLSAASFFRDLRSAVLRDNGSFVLVTQGPPGPSELEFATQIGIDEPHVVWTDLTALKVKILPTILVIDPSNRITFVKQGAIVSVDRDLVRVSVEGALR